MPKRLFIDAETLPPPEGVCRGGSMHALSEMCRTRYRFHEPPDFRAADLGFRLVKSGETTFSEGL